LLLLDQESVNPLFLSAAFARKLIQAESSLTISQQQSTVHL
jgi:hypothetical protein